MNRVTRIGLKITAAVFGLIVVLAAAVLIVIQTGWFRDYVRGKIVAAVDEATGGRSEIGAFRFSPFQLRAEVDNFVLHGTEGASAPPLFRTRSLVVEVKIVSVLARKFEIARLEIGAPQAYIEVKPDGTTNIPKAPRKEPSKKDPIETVLDLAIGHLRIDNGLVQFADKKTPLNVEGDNLRARMQYERLTPRYTGRITMTPVYVQKGGEARLPVNMDVAFALARNRIEVSSAKFDTPQSRLELTASLTDLARQRGSMRVSGRLSLPEVTGAAGVKTNADPRLTPPLDVAVSAGLDGNTLNLVGLQLGAGASHFEASGVLNDLKNLAGSLRFSGRVALGEIGRAMRMAARPEGTVTLGGDAHLAGAKNYLVTAKVNARDVAAQAGANRLAGIQASVNLRADPQRISAADIRLAALGGTFAGSAEVASMDRFRFDGQLDRFNLRYLARTYASRNLVWDGVISGPVHAAGRLKGEPVSRTINASVRLAIRPGGNGVPLAGRIDAAYDGPRNSIDLGNSYVQLPNTRLTLSGSIGRQLRINLASRNLNDLLPAIALASANPPKQMPVTLAKGGAASFDGTVAGSLSEPHITGHLAMDRFAANGQRFNRLAADLDAQASGASMRNVLLAGPGLDARVDASLGLRKWKPQDSSPVTAKLAVRSADVHDLLAAAGKGSTPFTGALTLDARVSGTFGDPRGNARLDVSKGKVGGEPFDRIGAEVNYAGQSVQLVNGEFVLPAGRVGLNAAFEHAPGQFSNGRLRFELTSTPIQLARLKTLGERRAGIAGTLNLQAKGAAEVGPSFRLMNLDANLGARGLELNKKRMGDLTLTANTSGQDLAFKLDSDVASSNVRGSGTVRLAGDYPLNASLTFQPIRLAPVMRLVSSSPQPEPPDWDGVIEGALNVSGPGARVEDLRGKLELTTVQVTASQQLTRQPVAIRNNGPITVTMENQFVRIQSARLTGPSTNLSLGGTVKLSEPRTVDVRADGNVGLEIARAFDTDIFASGNVKIATAVKGSLAQPAVDGRLELVNANVNYLTLPNGLSNGNGVIVFSGNQAVIQNLTGETGGGKLALSGLVRYGGPQLDFRMRASAERVRVRSGTVSVQVNSKLDLAGTSASSVLSGDVTIEEVAMYSHTDLGATLSQGGAPASTPKAKSGMLAGMRLDVRVATSPSVQFVTPLTQNLKADADLRVRGTAASPGLLGRVVVTRGEIQFFGRLYTVDQGTVSFYNATRIEPVLNVALTTQAKGVDVTLSVSGPMDNLKLTYHSDPPLQFSDIVGLLATGKTPTSDPVLAASQPPAPQQNWEQMGASAVLGQAVANPVSGRLQRLFGITRLKIDPQIIGAENTPQARVTLEQQVSREIFFTYIQDVRQSNPQVIRIEWALDPTWSAVATRQENGQFGVDFFYKTRFK
ncbi:MAG TPA: translocation/assembly module TamB domain-containing protein [Bryobacteraceae bacterium]|nr:translocation/assembly module TamB domain-containing protein [Bryobacteraceae bacterium]